MTDVPIFLINLDGSRDRLVSAVGQLAAAGLSAERIPAFDGRNQPVNALPGYDPAAALRYMGRPLRGGEVGCYLSHLAAARRVVDSGAPIGVVLEDDLAITPAGGETLRQTLHWLEAYRGDWHLLNAGANRRKLTSLLAHLPDGTRVERAHYFPMTTTALIWSQAGAQAFLLQPLRIDAAVDNHFRRWLTATDLGLSLWPAPVTTTGVDSLIDAGAGRRSRIAGRDALYGLTKQRRLWGQKLTAARHLLAARLRRG